MPLWAMLLVAFIVASAIILAIDHHTLTSPRRRNTKGFVMADEDKLSQDAIPKEIEHYVRPEGMSLDLYKGALSIIDDWEDHAERTQTDLAFALFQLFSKKV